MKKIFHILISSLLITSITIGQNKSQYDSFAVPIKVKPNAQLSKPLPDIVTNRVATCERPDVHVFPSNIPQSEVHISINKLNNQSLLISSNTFPIGNSFQGAYWSNNAGTTWQGSDILPNNSFGRGDPSTTYDALGRGYIATMAPNATAIAVPDGQRTWIFCILKCGRHILYSVNNLFIHFNTCNGSGRHK